MGVGIAGELEFVFKVVEVTLELNQELATRLNGLTLEDMIRRAEAVGMARPLAEPITFSI